MSEAALARGLPADLRFDEALPFCDTPERALSFLRRHDLETPAPAVVYLHGGAWRFGDRFSRLADRQVPLAQAGFATFSASYTLTGEASFPAQIHDAKAAIRHLRANAEDLGIDPGRIGVFGSSAGGHLAALLGTSIGVEELEGERGDLRSSSEVQAVCALFPPVCFETMDTFPEGVTPELEHASAASPEGGLLGGPLAEREKNARLASPLTWIRESAPPFLLLHGTKDPVVPFGQSEQLAAALRTANNPVELIAVDDLGHGGEGWAREMPRVIAFFTKHLLIATLVLLGACAHRGDPEAKTSTETDPTIATTAGASAESARGTAADPTDHASILRARMEPIVLCYEALLKEDAKLAGTFLATLDIAADGGLLSATLASEDTDPKKLETCLQTALKGTHFPASESEDGYLIEVPLTFAPKIVEPEPTEGNQAPAPTAD